MPEQQHLNIVNSAEEILLRYQKEVGIDYILEAGLDIREIYDNIIYPEHEVFLVKDLELGFHNNGKILGQFNPEERLVFLDKAITNEKYEPRYPFVVAHELGHFFSLEKRKTYFIEGVFNNSVSERLANVFAINLLAPTWLVKAQYFRNFGHRIFHYSNPGEFFINHQKREVFSLTHLCEMVAEKLLPYFSHMSKQSLGIRLLEIGLIKNNSEEVFSHEYTGQNKKQFVKLASILEPFARVMPK